MPASPRTTALSGDTDYTQHTIWYLARADLDNHVCVCSLPSSHCHSDARTFGSARQLTGHTFQYDVTIDSALQHPTSRRVFPTRSAHVHSPLYVSTCVQETVSTSTQTSHYTIFAHEKSRTAASPLLGTAACTEFPWLPPKTVECQE